jgi:hypothetical protein
MKASLYTPALAALLWTAAAAGGQWNGGGHLGRINLDGEAARAQGVEDTADSIGGYAEFRTGGLMAVSAGGEMWFYDDNAEFTQQVEFENFFGDEETDVESSDAYAIHLFADAGPHWRFDGGHAGLAAGFSSALYSERSISNCSDCREEDIDLDGGGYGKLAAGFKAGVMHIGLTYRAFFSGDIDNAVYLTVGTGF